MLISFVLGVVASVLAALLFPAVQDALVGGLVRVLRWLPVRRAASFGGDWRAEWQVSSDRYPSVVTDDDVQVRQVGRRLYAKFRAGALDCYLVGRVDGGRYITGTWHDETEGGYHGAFQFIVDPSTRNFTGLWIGFSTSGVVKHGTWKWERKNGIKAV